MRPRLTLLAGLVTIAAIVVAAASPPSVATTVRSGVGPALTSIGPLAFGPDGVLYAADPQSATIYALDLGARPAGAAARRTSPASTRRSPRCSARRRSEITITDLAVDPKHAQLVSRGHARQGADAKPALLRVDGAGKIESSRSTP